MKYMMVLILLAGCASPEQRAARESAYISALEARCEKLGFARDTDAITKCKLDMMMADRASANARASVAAQNAANVREAMKSH